MQVVSSPQRLSNLPVARTRLLGRADLVATGSALLREEAVPLLTLIGPGGVGKTRVALAVARDADEAFADGVCWVELAPASDAAAPRPSATRFRPGTRRPD